jgi:uncharacterized protein
MEPKPAHRLRPSLEQGGRTGVSRLQEINFAVVVMLKVNLRHLEEHGLHLRGEIPVQALELGIHDELIRAEQPLKYDLKVESLNDALLVTGTLTLPLDCECARCLKTFQTDLTLDQWAAHLPLEGEDKVSVENDSVDLTPIIREDILLDFPRHPVCKPDCAGLKKKAAPKSKAVQKPALEVWAKLDKLKLK